MKIKKTLFTTELEITPGEIMDFCHRDPGIFHGIYEFLKNNFGYEIVKYYPIKKKNK